jgi:hypothetical protein
VILTYFIKVVHLHYKSNLFVKVSLYIKLTKSAFFFILYNSTTPLCTHPHINQPPLATWHLGYFYLFLHKGITLIFILCFRCPFFKLLLFPRDFHIYSKFMHLKSSDLHIVIRLVQVISYLLVQTTLHGNHIWRIYYKVGTLTVFHGNINFPS